MRLIGVEGRLCQGGWIDLLGVCLVLELGSYYWEMVTDVGNWCAHYCRLSREH